MGVGWFVGWDSPTLDKSESQRWWPYPRIPRFLICICFGSTHTKAEWEWKWDRMGIDWGCDKGATHMSLDKSQSAYLLDWREHAKRIIDSQCV